VLSFGENRVRAVALIRYMQLGRKTGRKNGGLAQEFPEILRPTRWMGKCIAAADDPRFEWLILAKVAGLTGGCSAQKAHADQARRGIGILVDKPAWKPLTQFQQVKQVPSVASMTFPCTGFVATFSDHRVLFATTQNIDGS